MLKDYSKALPCWWGFFLFWMVYQLSCLVRRVPYFYYNVYLCKGYE